MKRIWVLLIIISMMSWIFVPAQAVDNGDAYNELKKDSFREAYRILEESIAGMAPVITLPSELQISIADLRDIARSVCLDHPEYFWFLESWFYEFGTSDDRFVVTTLTPTYHLDNQRVSAGSQELADAMIAFSDAVDRIIRGIPVNCTSEYDIALYLHDYLADHVTYTLEGDHDSAYAALVHGEAACYGYSKAYQYLLSRAGIRSRIIVGDSVASDGSRGGHAWNMVWLDGACYYTDVTWDDLEEGVTHQYFMISLEQIRKDHIADDLFSLEDCAHSLDYYELSAGKGVVTITESLRGWTAAEYFRLASVSDKGEAVFVCDARFECDFDTWMDANLDNLMMTLGLSYSSGLSYYYFDDVYYMIATDPAYRPINKKATGLTLNVTEATLVGEGAQVQLDATVKPFQAGIQWPTFVSDNESVAVVNEKGMVTAVAPGMATVTVTSYDGNVSAQCIITVEEGEVHQHGLRYIPQSDATCELDGNNPYYMCIGCFRRFADENAQTELTDVSAYAIPPVGHFGQGWGVKDHSHYEVCICGLYIPQTMASHSDGDGDGICDVCEAAMSQGSNQTQDPVGQEQTGPNWVMIVLIGVGVLAVAGVVVYIIGRKNYYW